MLAGSTRYCVAFPVVRRPDAAAAERGPEVDQVVPHERAAVFRDQHVERVDGLGVHVVQPRREHAVAAQLAPIFVRDEVVRVVGARADEANAADRLALERLARDDSVRSVGLAIGALEQVVDVAEPHQPFVAAGRRELRAVADDELLAAHVGDVVLRHVVAERPHQLRDGHFGPGRHAAVARRIEFQEPALTRRVLDRESRRHAVALRRGDRPRAGRRAVARVGAAKHVLRRQRTMTGAVGEPARVGDLVHRVEVLRARRDNGGAPLMML